MEITPVSLEFSEEMKALIEFNKWCELQWEKDLLKLGITPDQVGEPMAQSYTSFKKDN